MGLTLQPQAIKRSVRYPKAGVLALGLNVVVLPLLAALLALLLPGSMGAGLIVVAAVPCTLASASIWTRRGGGNDAVSMLVTLVTNLMCFVVTPATMRLLIGQSVEIDFFEQVKTLALIVVLPLVLAQFCRFKVHVARWADFHKVAISTVAQIGILVMVASGPAAAVLRMDSGQNSDTQMGVLWIGVMVVVTTMLHVVMLFGGWKLCSAIRLSHEDSVAVAIAGSQKTLMVGLQIAIDCGVSILPMIVYHVAQLIIDTFWVDEIRRRKTMKVKVETNEVNSS